MPNKKQIRNIKKLAKKGRSVNEIKERLDLPKSTVYYHFKKEVGQKQKDNQPVIPEDQEFKGEFCGIFAGDGSFYKDDNGHYRVRFTLNIQDDYWKKLSELLEDKLQKSPHINHQSDYNRTNLRYESKIIYEFLKQNLSWDPEDKTATISTDDSKEFASSFKRGFLRGLMDTDGTCQKYGLIFNTISEDLADTISDFLDDDQIEHSVIKSEDKRENCRDIYRVKTYGEDASKLLNKIEPRHPGKKSNKFLKSKKAS